MEKPQDTEGSISGGIIGIFIALPFFGVEALLIYGGRNFKGFPAAACQCLAIVPGLAVVAFGFAVAWRAGWELWNGCRTIRRVRVTSAVQKLLEEAVIAVTGSMLCLVGGVLWFNWQNSLKDRDSGIIGLVIGIAFAVGCLKSALEGFRKIGIEEERQREKRRREEQLKG